MTIGIIIGLIIGMPLGVIVYAILCNIFEGKEVDE